MLHQNFLNFLNFQGVENSLLAQNAAKVKFLPSLKCVFHLTNENRLEIVQTFFIFKQFFGLRPRISSIKKLHKSTFFTICVSLDGFRDSTIFFNFVRRLRLGSKRKLVSIVLKEQGIIYVSFRDFVTLSNFKIGKFDYHNWRRPVTVICSFAGLSDYQKNIYFNLFNIIFQV